MIVKVKKLHPEAKLPTQGSEEAACWDIYALEDTYIDEYRTTLVSTGLSLEVPEGYFLDIRPRSGLSSKVVISNSPGTLDSDYRGELKVATRAVVGAWPLGGDFPRIKKGDRIAQIRLEKVWPIQFKEVDELSSTKRGTGGFGSTGN